MASFNARRNQIRRPRMINEINMVPFIDVLLVILVLMMVTAQAATNYSDLSLPDAKQPNEDVKIQSQHTVVRISKTNKIFLNEQEFSTVEQLAKALTGLSKEAKDGEIEILGDKNTTYQRLTEILTTISAAGCKKLKLAYTSS